VQTYKIVNYLLEQVTSADGVVLVLGLGRRNVGYVSIFMGIEENILSDSSQKDILPIVVSPRKECEYDCKQYHFPPFRDHVPLSHFLRLHLELQILLPQHVVLPFNRFPLNLTYDVALQHVLLNFVFFLGPAPIGMGIHVSVEHLLGAELAHFNALGLVLHEVFERNS